ncbi:putative bacteriophage protein [Kluyvera georgiana ATCC 51603]|uniref:Putative bacteriophage protein n=2 Tax=Kluyvera georgiana TaxID=73098 RepID=A0A1B7JZF3_9ENTR|nr:putative bacteriophage protein [Kluyvera georgiana ATCC 51603]
MLARSNAALATSESDNRVLRSDNALQATVITTQAFNFNRFNQVAENASRLNSLIDAGTEKTVIEYREILRREKTCDLPVPADIAGGLLEYAHRLRTSAMHTDTNRPDSADDRAAAASPMTYCQAVLWIKPLLGVIEKGNNNFAGIRQIEQDRK